MLRTALSSVWSCTAAIDGAGDSGDFVVRLQLDAGRRAIVVGDLAGHGTSLCEPAQILRAFVSSRASSGATPAEIAGEADAFFTNDICSERVPFASLFVAVADAATRELTYASAGHETAIVFEANDRHRHLSPTGPILGLADLYRNGRRRFAQETARVRRGDVLVVVTDGITDARPLDGRLHSFGCGGVSRTMHEMDEAEPDPAAALFRAAKAHASFAMRDDASVLVTSFGNDW